MQIQNNDIYERAIKHFGIVSQFDKAEEELTELLLAIKQFRNGKCEARDVATEIADVEIMYAQLRILIGEDIVEREKVFKLKRLESMIAE
jgi:hypothetical protein